MTPNPSVVEVDAALRSDYFTFFRRVFGTLHPDVLLEPAPYLTIVSAFLYEIFRGNIKRGILNLPPRHLKTEMGTVAFICFELGHHPSNHVILLTYGEALAEPIARKIRKVLLSRWYQRAFQTRLVIGARSVIDFETVQGGGMVATSFRGFATGRGADLLIVDDPHKIQDSTETLEAVTSGFGQTALSRLNNPAQARVLIVGHRTHPKDLTGHLLLRGGWHQVALPLIAERQETYSIGNCTWKREKDSFLRPDAYTVDNLQELKRDPHFEFLYQQGLTGNIAILPDHFPRFSRNDATPYGRVFSIDTAQGKGYSVIQVWQRHKDGHRLRDQFHEKCDFPGLWKGYARLAKRYDPTVVLIEETGVGPALISRAKQSQRTLVVPILPGSSSKFERLKEVLPIILDRQIHLPADAPWAGGFLDEVSSFPHSDTNDQIDAMTMYLRWSRGNSNVEFRPMPDRFPGAVTFARPGRF